MWYYEGTEINMKREMELDFKHAGLGKILFGRRTDDDKWFYPGLPCDSGGNPRSTR